QTMEEQTIESRKTPIMGWSSWNALGSSISEEKLKEQMDLMVSLGLKDAGYVYFNTDDGFQNGRDATTGRLRVNETKFPNGMKVIADYAHSKGLKAGIYTDAGDNNCSWSSDKTLDWGVGVGLYQHENDDLYRYLGDGIYRDTYAQNHPEDPGVECWGFDFIKVDWCGGQNAKLSAQTQYTKIGNIINEIEGVYNKDKIYNICMWAYEVPF
ncbi:MAG: glycoside hydrolase family 27 protein, partial [Clostridia bacterium]|nr:glycoside hydrolase family 27 protein [Clostridia bacterium]